MQDTDLDFLGGHMLTTPIRVAWRTSYHLDGERSGSTVGKGNDFVGFREYQQDRDDVRRINHRMLARRPEPPVVNEFHEDRQIVVSVVVDIGTTMRYGTQELTKRELAAVIAASCAESAGITNDSLQLITFSSTHIEMFPTRLAANSGQSCLEDIMREPTDVDGAGGLENVLPLLPKKRSLVIIISDFRKLSAAALELLADAGIAHDIVCVIVEDLRECELPRTKLIGSLTAPMQLTLVDAEGNVCDVLTTRGECNRYAAAAKARRDKVITGVVNAGCAWVRCGTEDSEDQRGDTILAMLNGERERSTT